MSSRLVASIPECLKSGDIFFVNGRATSSSANFKVNLQDGESEDANVLLHVNPRLGKGEVVRNTRIDGSWGTEETGASMPFAGNANFALIIAALQDRFQIFINGKHFANFEYRTPLNSGTVLLVDGDVSIYNVIVESPCQKVYPPIGRKKIKPEHVLALEFNPLIPATLPIPGGMSPGKLVLLAGIPSSDCSKFEINLQEGSGDSGNILVHVNPRFEEGPSVVRNSRLESTWGNEELDGGFPFERGVHFDLIIFCDDQHFHVWVNGQPTFDFTHRTQPQAADHLSIAGQVFVKRVLMA